MIFTCRDLPYHDRLSFLNLPSLQYRRLRGDVLFLYQITNNFYDVNMEDIFSFSTVLATRGHNKKLFKPHTYCLKVFFFTIRVINNWNSLPQSVINATSTNQFKHR